MATLTLTLAASTDDAAIDDGAYSDTDTTSRGFGGVSTTPNANFGQGFRFNNCTLTNADTVTSAYLALMSSETRWGNIDVRLTCIAEDDTATFSSGSAPGSRAIVTNIAVQAVNISHTSGVAYNYPESGAQQTVFGAAVQEVLARGGWASGNDIACVNNSDQDASAAQTFAREAVHWWDSATASSEPQLVITYTPAPAPQRSRAFQIITRPAAFKPGLAR